MLKAAGLCALALVGLALPAAPAAAVSPAPLHGFAAARIEPAEFRFPWESRAKPKKKKGARRTGRPDKPRSQKRPAASEKARRPAKAAPAAPVVAADPADAPLPALAGPLDVATPRGRTQREAEKWAEVAAQLAPPSDPPLLPPEGPAPAPAYVTALIALPQPREAEPARAVTPVARPPASDDGDVETPDLHVPLPPIRPRAPGEAAAKPPVREGLSREGGLAPENGLAPEGGLSPENPPLPPVRPGGDVAALEPPPGPTAPDIALPVVGHDEDADCRALAAEDVAEAERIPPILGPGVCGGGPLVTLTGVKRRDGETVRVKPAATLRCAMARELAAYLRDDVAPAADAAGAGLVRLEIAGSFQCRGRNGSAGGKMSEHGRANAVDLSGIGLSDGRSFGVFAPEMPQAIAAALKSGACARFSTVLGPGSDGFHESHLHLDLQPRRSKSKLCQWSEPEVAGAKPDEDKGSAKATPDDDGERRAAARRKSEPEKTEPKRSGAP